MEAKAIVFPQANQAELRSFELDEIRDNEFLTQTLYSGISIGTETWVLKGHRDDVEFPCVPGYQNIGKIIKVGKKVKGFKKGDLVMQSGFCRMPKGLNTGCGSCHSSHLIGIAKDAVKLDPSINKEEAILSWVAGCALEGNLLGKTGKGDVVVVVGQGLIGQMSAQIARARGAKVIAAEMNPLRLKLSKRNSADKVIDVNKGPLVDQVLKMYPEGVDVFIEATGNKNLVGQAAAILKHGGRVVFQGWYPGDMSFHFHDFHMKEISFHLPCAWGWGPGLKAIQKLLKAKKLHIKPLITHRFTSENATEAYKVLLEKPQETLGMVIKW